ncbi:hypothetical protein OPV22_014487 [Ensete ventricosum]|uniref:Proteasome maturation factor UMP1 n=1 Tax=Ensete ventricosum TaxID=4639 RepID=A0AAV8RC07_ENSVE|nr:hypothetical protein OPV22_014487 [Ensete ventricosum]
MLSGGDGDGWTRILGGEKEDGLGLYLRIAFNLRRDLDAQILSRFQRPPGTLPTSMLGFEALTGGLDDFTFEDYLNFPLDSETSRPPDMHRAMEVRLGISKGPVCPPLILSYT